MWVSNHIVTKPVANKQYPVDATVIGFKDKCLTRGDLDEVCREVSRSHSTLSVGDSGEGQNINRSELSRDEMWMYSSSLIPVQALHEEEHSNRKVI